MLTSCQCYIFFSLSNVVIYVKLFEKYENKIEIEIEKKWQSVSRTYDRGQHS